MRGDHHRAWPGVEQVLQRRQGVGVEVVGRLVEQQYVRLGREQAKHLQPAPLATGEVGHGCPQSTLGEAEDLRELSGGEFPAAEVDPAGHLLDGLEHPGRFGQFSQLLGQKCRPYGRADPNLAAAERLSTGEHAKQRRLASPVAADDRRSDRPGPTSQSTLDRRVRSPSRTVASRQRVDLLAQPRGRESAQRHRVAGLRHVGDECVCRVDAELGLRRACRRPTAQPRDLLPQQVLPPCLDRRGDAGPLGTGEHPRGVSAVVRPYRLVRRPPRSGCRPHRGTNGRG